jgi:hypothetical protein
MAPFDAYAHVQSRTQVIVWESPPCVAITRGFALSVTSMTLSAISRILPLVSGSS